MQATAFCSEIDACISVSLPEAITSSLSYKQSRALRVSTTFSYVYEDGFRFQRLCLELHIQVELLV